MRPSERNDPFYLFDDPNSDTEAGSSDCGVTQHDNEDRGYDQPQIGVEVSAKPPDTNEFSIEGDLVSLDTIEPRPVKWLWDRRFIFGLNILAGDPDVGKSTVLLDIAARVSTGANWP